MASFSNLGADVVVDADGTSVVREHPTELPLSTDVRRSSANRGKLFDRAIILHLE